MQVAQSWLCGLCAACSLWTLPAAAHAPPQASGIYTSGSQRWVRTNRGLIFHAAANEPQRLLCNDAYGASLSEVPPVVVAPGGLIVATYAEGVLQITPDGCRAQPLDVGLGDREIADLTTTPDGSRYIALVSPSPTRAGGILVSSDRGTTWTAGAELTSFGTALAVAPSDPDRVYVSAITETADGSPANELLVSRDGSATFTSQAFELETSEVRAFVLAVDPDQPDRVFLRTLPGNPEMPERLLLSEDAGSTFSEVYSAVGPLVLTRFGQSWWLGGKAGLFRSSDGGKNFTPVPGAPSYVGCLRGDASGLEICGYQNNEFGIFRANSDVVSFSPELRFGDVTEQVACGEDVVETCRANFEDWLSEVASPNVEGGGAHAGGSAGSAQSGVKAGSQQSPSASKGPSSAGCTLGAANFDQHALVLGWLSSFVWAMWRRTRRRVPT